METTDRFGPKLYAFWKKAIEREVKVSLPTHAEAIALRHRLYRFRSALANEGHPTAELAKLCTLRIVPVDHGAEDTTWDLICSRIDKQFEEALKDFDIEEAPDIT